MVAILHALTKAESYGYCQGQVVDLGPMMLGAQFWVTEEGGTYLCTARALGFEGSIFTYNPTLNEAEWMPACGLANDLSWAEERSAVALANYVPCASAEVAWITRLGAGRVVSCPSNDSSTSEKGQESWHPDAPSTDEEEVGNEGKEGADGQMSPGDEAETDTCTDHCWCPQNWEVIMEESEGLAYNDPHSDYNTTVMGADGLEGPQLSCDEPTDSPPNTLRGLASCSLGSPMEHMPLLVPTVTSVDMVEVHVTEVELDDL